MDLFTRQTSIESYKYLVDNKIIGKRQAEVYKVLLDHGPLTCNETFNILKTKVSREFSFDSNTHARFTELRDMDLIEELGTRKDSFTGRNVILWGVTNRPPKKIKKSIEDEIKKLDIRIEKLVAKRNKLLSLI